MAVKHCDRTVYYRSTLRPREIAFAKAVSLDKAGGSLDEIIAKESCQATNYNRLSDTYERALG